MTDHTPLEEAAAQAEEALAAFCYDSEDPGSNALGALWLLGRHDLPKTNGLAEKVLRSHDADIIRRCALLILDLHEGKWAEDTAKILEVEASLIERGEPTKHKLEGEQTRWT